MKTQHLIISILSGLLVSACGGSEINHQPTVKEETLALPKPTHKAVFTDRPISSGDLNGLWIDAGNLSPVVLIVPGSGPTDLDGNNPMDVTANSYKLLAEGLAAKGISTVRVDKRGMFSSSGAGDANAVTVDIYAQDYKDWAETIITQTGRSCVYMLGHSEGGIMVSAAAIENINVCGLILVSAPGRPFGDILREQLKANPANIIIIKPAFAAIETLEGGEHVDTENMHPALKPLFYPAVQDFLISVMAKDPAQVAKEAAKPTLIVQGSHDIQVKETDAELLAASTGGELVIIDGMNHVLKDSPANRIGNMMTYKNPDLPIAPEILESIRSFVTND
ncbi:alpha/beta hydrolase [Hellea balneolensis]|uniref:alpha/beta hydrolase n=1 Tax=Hellea balneolensis TaxID=287478 RepID=UPI00068407BB|nr:alpha/beta fold hydrolase [Hellea balneolensis]